MHNRFERGNHDWPRDETFGRMAPSLRKKLQRKKRVENVVAEIAIDIDVNGLIAELKAIKEQSGRLEPLLERRKELEALMRGQQKEIALAKAALDKLPNGFARDAMIDGIARQESVVNEMRLEMDSVCREIAECGKKPGDYAKLIQRVSERYNVPMDVIMDSERRKGGVTLSRNECFFLLREMGLSYPKIGAIMKKDHSTVLHGVKAFRKKLKEKDIDI